MDPTNIVHPPGDHARTVRGDNPQQRRYGHVRPMLGHQAIGAQPAAPVTAVAGHVQHGEACGNLAEGNDAVRQGLVPFLSKVTTEFVTYASGRLSI
jgi:hypothetical protein